MAKRLDEAFEEIMTAIKSMLEAECHANGMLAGVEAVVRGDRARPKPPTPCIWVFGETANPSHNPTTIQERWSLPIVLTSIYKSDDPEVGYRKASEFAAKARSIILRDRTLGLRDFVQDTRSGRFEPSGPWHSEGQLYGAVAVVEVTFRIREGS